MATGKVRLPTVERRVGGMTSVDVDDVTIVLGLDLITLLNDGLIVMLSTADCDQRRHLM